MLVDAVEEGIADVHDRRLGDLIAGRLDQTAVRFRWGIDFVALSHLLRCLVFSYRHVALGAMRHRYASDLFIFDLNRDGMLADLVDFVLPIRVQPISDQLWAAIVVVLCGCGADKRNAADQGEDSTAISDHHGCS